MTFLYIEEFESRIGMDVFSIPQALVSQIGFGIGGVRGSIYQ